MRAIMVRFTNRNDVLSWIVYYTSRHGIVRAIQEGRAEYLGGFRFIRKLNSSGWICRVTSKYGRVWIVACGINGTLKYLNTIPWNHYVGSTTGNSLYAGDNPKEYIGFRRLSYFENKRKQRPTKDWAGQRREDNGSTDNAPLDTANSVSVRTRLSVGIKNLWKRFL